MALRKRRVDHGTHAENRDNVIEAPIPRRLSVSETLRGRRLDCGLEIAHVAEILRIRPPILEAIENGQFDQLPGSAYAVGFVRSYATYLGLDAESLVLRFKAEVEDVSRKPNLNFPLPVSESRVPTGAIMLIGFLLAVLAYGGWYYFSAQHGDISSIVAAVPDRLNHLVSPDQVKKDLVANADRSTAPAASAVPQTQPAASQVQQTAPVARAGNAPQPAAPQPPPARVVPPAVASSQPSPANPVGPANPASVVPPSDADDVPPVADGSKSPNAVAALPAQPDLARPALSDPGKAAAPASYGAPAAEARVVVKAVADSWIEVRDAQSNLLITRVLKPGESYNVPNQPGLTLRTGNAGGLDLLVDGTEIPRIGDTGQVRNVALDPDRLRPARPRAN